MPELPPIEMTRSTVEFLSELSDDTLAIVNGVFNWEKRCVSEEIQIPDKLRDDYMGWITYELSFRVRQRHAARRIPFGLGSVR